MVIIMGFLMIGMLSIMLPRADVAAQRIDEVLKTESSIADPSTEVCRDDELAAHTGGAEIAFNDVSFKISWLARLRARACRLHREAWSNHGHHRLDRFGQVYGDQTRGAFR